MTHDQKDSQRMCQKLSTKILTRADFNTNTKRSLPCKDRASLEADFPTRECGSGISVLQQVRSLTNEDCSLRNFPHLIENYTIAFRLDCEL